MSSSGSKKKCKVKSYPPTRVDSADVPPPIAAPNFRSVKVPFKVGRVTFVNDDGHECGTCEYRQYLSGYIIKRSPGGAWRYIPPSPFVPWTEDRDTGGNNYGHRGATEAGGAAYYDDDGTINDRKGCNYSENDSPYVNVVGDEEWDLNLNFKGDIVEAQTSLQAVAGGQQFWNVRTYMIDGVRGP